MARQENRSKYPKIMLRFIIYSFIILFITFLLSELLLRLVTVKRGHISYVLNKPWNYLVPFDTPKHFPNILRKEGAYRVYDPLLGWTLGKLGHNEPLYFSNNLGVRCSKQEYEYEKTSRDKKTELLKNYDIICIGDSFTHGDEVKYEETWPFYLAKISGLRVLNLGVGAYGIDQAGLKFKYSNVKCQILILGLIAGDLERATTQIYNLTNGGLKTKPLFKFSPYGVTILNQPALHGEELKKEFKLGIKSTFFANEPLYYPNIFASSFLDKFYLYRVFISRKLWRTKPIYLCSGPRFDYIINILNYIRNIAMERKAQFYILLLDNGNTFGDRKTYKNPWEHFIQRCDEENINYLFYGDRLYNQYLKNPDQILNKGQVHYTPYAHYEIAKFIIEKNIINVQKVNP